MTAIKTVMAARLGAAVVARHMPERCERVGAFGLKSEPKLDFIHLKTLSAGQQLARRGFCMSVCKR